MIFKELFRYRELLRTNVKKEIRGKYKASFLGILWSFINPLLQVLVYAIVFPYLLKDTGGDYIVYLVTGIIPWTFFAQSINQCTSTIKANAGIIKKVYFPREILPLSVIISGMINFFISCLIILLFCICFKIGISWHIIFVPLIVFIQAIISLGLGLMLSALTAYIQDLEYIINFILMLAFYGSPIVYKLETFGIHSKIAYLVNLNPMTILISAYRDCFIYHQLPNLGKLLIIFIFALFVTIIGIIIFKKLEKGFAEQL